MSTIKHSLSLLNSSNDPLSGFIGEAALRTDTVSVILMLFALFVISSFVISKRLNDQNLGTLYGLFMTALMSTLLFFGGKVFGVEFLKEIIYFGIMALLSISIAGMYYARSNQNE